MKFWNWKKKEKKSIDEAAIEWTPMSALLGYKTPEEREKRKAAAKERELEILMRNEADEHDGTARKVGGMYLRGNASWDGAWLTIRTRAQAPGEEVKFTPEHIPALREAADWLEDLKKEYEKKAEED